MAWADLPALYIRPVRHGAIPIGDPHRVRLSIEDISLEFPHLRALPGGVRLVQHLFVERHLVWIFELGVIAVEDRAGKVFRGNWLPRRHRNRRAALRRARGRLAPFVASP